VGTSACRLNACRVFRRAEDAEVLLLKGVDDAVGERVFGPDYGQADPFLLGKADELVELVDINGDILAVQRGAGIARRAEDAFNARRLGQLPDEGMLAAAFADDEDFHALPGSFAAR
jgi:hypothetical protein